MIPSIQKMYCLQLLLLVVFISLTNTVLAQWVQVDTSGIITSIAGDGKYIYAGVRASGIIRSSDNGTTWVDVSNGLGSPNTISVGSFCVTKNNILAGTGTGIFISSDHGDHWTKTSFDPVHVPVYGLLAVDSLIFAGFDTGVPTTHHLGPQQGGIFLSTDSGQSWVRSDSGIGSDSNHYGVHAFAKIGSTLFTTTSQGFFYSNDNGKNWKMKPGGGGGGESMTVIDSTLFVGSGYPFRSSDMGASWTMCDSGLPKWASAPYLASNCKYLIVGSTFNGVYFSADMGDHWKPFNEGLESSLSQNIFSLAIIGNYVFAGGGLDLWRRPLSEITSVERIIPSLSNGFELNQNYPNPFNPSTEISYQLSSASYVVLKVYDVIGREAATLVNGNQYAGMHVVHFNGSSLASGVYFYGLRVNGSIVTKKMMLIK